MNKRLIDVIWLAALPFLSLHAQSYASAAMPAEGDSTSAGNQPMRVMTFKAVPGTARTYYYHRDHLGSTTLITNDSGEVVQRVEYLPTGETFIEQQDTSWVSPHKFNGKELDEETGLYYYGARYYDPRLSLWLGTDPMQGKYPGVSTYAYCHNNPIVMKDINGADDIFSMFGFFIKDTGKGEAVLIQTPDGLRSLSSFSYAKSNPSEINMLLNISSHYLSKIDDGFMIFTTETKGTEYEWAAFANSGFKYYVVVNDGSISPFLDNKYDFESVLTHESIHRYNESTLGGTIGEVNAILLQSSCEGWRKTSNNYKRSQANYALLSLNKAIKRGEMDELLIYKYVSDLNEVFRTENLGFLYNQEDRNVEFALPETVCTTGKIEND